MNGESDGAPRCNAGVPGVNDEGSLSSKHLSLQLPVTCSLRALLTQSWSSQKRQRARVVSVGSLALIASRSPSSRSTMAASSTENEVLGSADEPTHLLGA